MCIIISLSTTVNSERKRNALQDYKKAEILVWKNFSEKKLLQIYITFRGRGGIIIPVYK